MIERVMFMLKKKGKHLGFLCGIMLNRSGCFKRWRMNKTNVKKELKKTIEKIERGVKDIKIWCEDDGTGGSDCGYDCDEVLKLIKEAKRW
jgi:hypothetical protein